MKSLFKILIMSYNIYYIIEGDIMTGRRRRLLIVILIMMLFGILLIVIGSSYAFFTYSKKGQVINTIETGTLSFFYDEDQVVDNGITLSNASPMSDSEGKVQSGTDHVFEFQISASTVGKPIYYEIYLTKEDNSTLPEKAIKTYLTTVVNGVESDINDPIGKKAVNRYESLGVSGVSKEKEGRTLYQAMISNGVSNWKKIFRLRMWISEDANQVVDGKWIYSGMTFSVKVNVHAQNEILPTPIRRCDSPVYADTSGANSPKLVTGMIPVVYNECKQSWEKADVGYWYDYDQQIWANAVTVTEGTRGKYTSAKAGTEISMADINAMWVWIPRYEYQYTNLEEQYAGGTKEQPREIKINFIEGTTTAASDASIYKVHPAFTFNGKEVTGIWYAKFETTGTLSNPCSNTKCDTSRITIKPGLTSLRNQTVSSFFYMARSMQLNNASTFGFRSDSGDVHMSKNSEWGAAAYLSQSKYGKYGNINYIDGNREVTINNCSQYITGIGGDTVNASESRTTCNTNTYETLKGQSASTTGNITGIYDMSGGAQEYVMGNYNKLLGNSGFTSLPETKYYDLYISENSLNACSGGICYGHSLVETAGWYYDDAGFVLSISPWFNRGGNYYSKTYSGIFASLGSNGSAKANFTSRITIVP